MDKRTIFTPRTALTIILLAAFALIPLLSDLLGQSYYTTFATRILIMAMAASGLNLALGYGGMLSLGHALYMGIGAYAAGICAYHGIGSGWLQLLFGLVVGGIVAIIVGLISLRTSGMAFIMITLAFAQMLYFLIMTLTDYGGDDGLSIAHRSVLSGLDLTNNTVLYYVVLATFFAILFFMSRMMNARFGKAVQGCRSNERRMKALGFSTIRYRLAAYILSALICVIAGFFLANLVQIAAPSYVSWTVSGDLMVMVVLGGQATIMGPLVGAIMMLMFEELFASGSFGLPYDLAQLLNNHWMALLGLFIVVVTMTVKRGIFGSIPNTWRRHERVV
ncbi:branched-chain amino acid ABC transporter permease [Paraburkholderia sp. CNPSo 3155]|uniref:branched-chain amino acid ABC transporter permease n=1 Tax=Paraburkholderia atlantica TaxID=2654982 RepID=UPI00128DC5B7|nr:branched-chain amino acid ABC transporter permease [Paraburkholderia atlantica]MPW10957.1 branched-chain amino acid ABC transporter permease [Paraburkholderia atlantica]